MSLYIRFGSLHRFKELYNCTPYLQNHIVRHSNIHWGVDGFTNLEELERVLKLNHIKYTIE